MQSVTTDIITRYQTAIHKIASKVAGSRKDILEDLTQEGLRLFCQLYPQNAKWSFLSRAIKNRMLDHKGEITTPIRIPETSRRVYGIKIYTVELTDTLQSKKTQSPEAESLLQRLEADIKQLPKKDRVWAEKALATLVERNPKHPPSKKGMAIINRLKAKYLAEYLILTQ